MNLANTTVALKEMLLDPEHPDLVRRKFHDKMTILSKLRHPAIPRVLQTFAYGETVYIAMDYVQGRNLARC